MKKYQKLFSLFYVTKEFKSNVNKYEEFFSLYWTK